MSAAEQSGALPLPRWALYLMLPGMIAPLGIFVFILVTEHAHDTRDCPYRELERRALGPSLYVVEEQRSCIDGVEEHRYHALRDGKLRLLGERRFASAAFQKPRYRWHAGLSPAGEVHVVVENDGHKPLRLREGTPQEHAE